MSNEIYDLVVPFVDNNEPVWQQNFLDFCRYTGNYKKMGSMRSGRYQDDIRLIEYLLKLVNKNMPWIRTIHLLLSNKEQAPKHLPKNVQVHLHYQFIPHKYLPTFNSTTIEMFLGLIPNLSERFIYANDDMLPLKELKPSDFFEEDKIKMNFTEENINEFVNVFRCQCYNSYKDIEKALNIPCHNVSIYLRPIHSYTPMFRSHCLEAYKLIEQEIIKNIGAFRTEKQHNQYIYPCYEKLVYGCLKSNINFYYSQLDESVEDLIEKLHTKDIICVNKIGNPKLVPLLVKELNDLCK